MLEVLERGEDKIFSVKIPSEIYSIRICRKDSIDGEVTILQGFADEIGKIFNLTGKVAYFLLKNVAAYRKSIQFGEYTKEDAAMISSNACIVCIKWKNQAKINFELVKL